MEIESWLLRSLIPAIWPNQHVESFHNAGIARLDLKIFNVKLEGGGGKLIFGSRITSFDRTRQRWSAYVEGASRVAEHWKQRLHWAQLFPGNLHTVCRQSYPGRLSSPIKLCFPLKMPKGERERAGDMPIHLLW